MREVMKRSEEEIMKNWKENNTDNPLVSIFCITYNHEKYISEAIDSFLMQETDFSFEILIHDDASDDKTVNIIKEYEEKYPTLIKSKYQKENQFSKGISPLNIMLPYLKGKYIATCEGDDYWIDPKKLQIQIDFLEKNPEYVISGHDAKAINDEGDIILESFLSNECKRDSGKEELIERKVWMLSMARVYRNIINEMPKEYNFVLLRDAFFLSLIGNYGKGKYHDDIKPAVYRIHGNGIWSKKSENYKNENEINKDYWLYMYYKRTNNEKYSLFYRNEFEKKIIINSHLKVIFKEVIKRVLLLKSLKKIYLELKSLLAKMR